MKRAFTACWRAAFRLPRNVTETIASDQPSRPGFFALLVLALWLGGGAFLVFVAAPAAFAGAADRTSAANVVGEMLRKWHYLSLVAPALLMFFEWRRGLSSTTRVALLSVAILLAATQSAADLKIRRIRSDSVVAISELPRTDPVRRRFGMLHGASTALMILQVVAAAAVLRSVARKDAE
jgi:uncharacterized membrane protein